MSIVSLQNEHLRLDILPEAGASIVNFSGRIHNAWVPLMRETPPEAVDSQNPSLMSSFTLAPWSNRLPDAQFIFKKKKYTLISNTPEGYAMHGDVRRRPWKTLRSEPTVFVCTIDSREFVDFNFPFPLTIEIRHELSANKLITSIQLTNVGPTEMPAGFGFHPYFNRRLRGFDGDEALLQLNVAGVYPPLPGGPMLPISPDQDFSIATSLGLRDVNHCFGGWEHCATITYPQAQVCLRMECSALFNHVVLFTPPEKPYFAVEPISHATNGFNLFAQGQTGTGIQVLAPEETMRAQFVLDVS